MIDVSQILSAMASQVGREALTAVRNLIQVGKNESLSRINPLRFAGEHGLDEVASIAAFVRATHAGLFDLNWSVLCSSCAGTLRAGRDLRDITEDHYNCTLCRRDTEPLLDKNVEVTFTVSPRVRKIPAHSPHTLSFWDYAQKINWSSGVELPSDVSDLMGGVLIDTAVVAGQAGVRREIELGEGTVVVFDLVTHTAQFLQATGQRSAIPQQITVELNEQHAARPTICLQPGTLQLEIRNNTAERTLPVVLRVDESLLELVGHRVPFLTAKRLLTDQTFRDLYRTNVLHIDQRFKITSMTFLFTDLKGSTELYERVGDLAAYDVVQLHFKALAEIVAGESGAIVKTIGDSVMASFPTPRDGLTAALRMSGAMDALNHEIDRDDIILKIGLHAGPCLAVALNDRQDYFGQAVNIASRLQNMAKPRSILTTAAVIGEDGAAALVANAGVGMERHQSLLRGIQKQLETFEIIDRNPS